MFTPGNLTPPYHSVNTDVSKRIRYLDGAEAAHFAAIIVLSNRSRLDRDMRAMVECRALVSMSWPGSYRVGGISSGVGGGTSTTHGRSSAMTRPWPTAAGRRVLDQHPGHHRGQPGRHLRSQAQ